MNVKQRGDRGFALTIELLLGMVLLVLAILGLFTLFPSADKAIVNSDKRTQAIHLARQLMEQQLVTTYDSLAVGEVQGALDSQNTLRRGARATTNFLYKVNVSQPDPAKDVKEVVVTVNWLQSQKNSEVTLSSTKGRLW
jgi:Tfp pilus assembly protein PilV